jgi:hypothetical protein
MGAEGTGKGNLWEAGRGCFYRITQAFYSMRTCFVILTNVGMEEGLLLVDSFLGAIETCSKFCNRGKVRLAVCALVERGHGRALDDWMDRCGRARGAV